MQEIGKHREKAVRETALINRRLFIRSANKSDKNLSAERLIHVC
jgi:hypothetical protein